MAVPQITSASYFGGRRFYSMKIDDGAPVTMTDDSVAEARQRGDVRADAIQAQIDSFKAKLPSEIRMLKDFTTTSPRHHVENVLPFCADRSSGPLRGVYRIGTVRNVPDRSIAIEDRNGDGKVDWVTFKTADGVRVMIKAMEERHRLGTTDGQHLSMPQTCVSIDPTRDGVENYLKPLDALFCLGCNLD